MAEGIAHVEYDVGRVVVEFDYDRDLIDDLKASIEPQWRSWDDGRKVWTFTPSVWPEVERILETYGLTIID